ncbi:TIGR02302 family protein [Methylocystis heyeri]|uniref:TIGR02302 family protein n=1 Tax=Methylocystis heyeri TaxID=391905 RepID=A0A6B8KAL1_9HYPH|nr:TIGR02302 family protein [Methylocystis heyeri]QGM44879.1 TIGR02302 family protein [Methylocystis heyeri]
MKFWKPKAAERPDLAMLELMARRSQRMLLAERALRLGAALASLALFFLALSWSGIWLEVGPLFRVIGVALFGQAALTLCLRELLRGWPSRSLALRRLDGGDSSGLRPATALEDRLAAQDPDPATATLWEAHRRRLERALGALRIAPPRPEIEKRDPYALRALALVAAVAMAFAAGDRKAERLRAAFDWRGAGAARETVRFDAWLDPPPYTGRQALVLEDKDIGQTVEVPVNSILRVRFGGRVETEGALQPLAGEGEAPKAGPAEQRFKLAGPARLKLPDGRAFNFAVIPDNPPRIELKEPPKNNFRGSMTLAYKSEDDYGVIGAQALLSLPPGRRVLFPPPSLPLSLPQDQGGRGEAQTTLDLSDSPWAGAQATLRLEARDEGGNVGLSEPIETTLPQRHFRKPLARALAEQRRKLALDPDDRGKVRLALDALSIAPDAFDTPSSIYLGLRMARRDLEGERSDEELKEVADLLWAMALGLEDGDLNQAERDLRAAQRNLKEALARGADEQEIAKLTEELRDAMAKFLQGMSEQAQRDRNPATAQSQAGEGREISKEELDKMLEELDQANKAGDTERAQALLDQLTNLLENLQPSQGSRGANSQMRQRGQSLSELDRLSREQQQLRDETYQGGAEKSEGRPQAGRNGAQKGAAERQKALRERLESQRDALRRSGEGAPADLDEADKAMKEAEQALEQGKAGAGKAVEAQGRALQALRRGADELAQRGKGEDGQAEEDSDGGQGGQSRGRMGSGQDPLGRAAGAQGRYDSHSRYDPMGLPPAQRARKVQDEVRRRLGQPERPAEELDYLQRLLKR